jgi:excisionase family DNA binding protein
VEAIAYTIQQAADLCGVDHKTIRKAINSGQLTAKYPTSRPVIMRTDLELWLSNAPESRAS